MSSILVLSGSPRKNGNTDSLVGAFSEGALNAGNTVDVLRVADYDVTPCMGCNACAGFAEIRCSVHDDMDIIYDAMMCHDTLIIASPLYFYSLSAQLKAVVDRFHTPARNNFTIRRVGLIIVGAALLPDMFDAVLSQYELIRRYFKLEDIGKVLVQGIRETDDTLLSPALKNAFEFGASI